MARKPIPRPKAVEVDPLLLVFKDMMIRCVQSLDRDLNQRQLSVFLIVALEEGAHTVRGLAERLNVGKTTITRAIDRLEEFDYVRRNIDPDDRRSVVVTRTTGGTTYVKMLSRFIKQEG